MPNQLEGFPIGHQAKVGQRRLFGAMILALVVGIPVSFMMYYSQGYQMGVDRAPG